MTKYIVIALSFLFLAGCDQTSSSTTNAVLDIECYSGNIIIYKSSGVSLEQSLYNKNTVLYVNETDGKVTRVIGATCVITDID